MALYNETQALQGLQNQTNTIVSGFQDTWNKQEYLMKQQYNTDVNYKQQTIDKAKGIVNNAKQSIANFISTLKYTKNKAQSDSAQSFAQLDKLLTEFINSINSVPLPTPKPVEPIYYTPPPGGVTELDSYLQTIGI